MSGEADLDKILGHLRFFGASIPHLPLYRRLVEGLTDDPVRAGFLLDAQPGQARPVLLLAAVHAVVLAHPDEPLARYYPSVTPPAELAPGDPYPAFTAFCEAHEAEIRQLVATRSTQTNEVNRVALLAPMFAHVAASEPTLPMSVVELGSSAGLLLGLERYRCDVGGAVSGNPASSVHLHADVSGTRFPPTWVYPPSPAIVERVGIDLAPVSLDDLAALRWLEACLWPDQPERIDRFRAAVALLRDDPPSVVAGDFIEALPGVIDQLQPATHLVVFHGWALTYVERERRPELAEVLARAAASGRPVSWLSAEAPRCVPGIDPPTLAPGDEEATPETVLGLRTWRHGVEQQPRALGWAHPHGAFLTWEV